MPLSLVILAAGKGTRFGGDKPLAAVGPDGQSLFEYSVYDAFKAGFKHVVFVVSDQQDTAEFTKRLHHYGDELKIEFVMQSLMANLAPRQILHTIDRNKPWGTAHAVLVCRELINNPFVVINADDYYGQENFRKIGNYLLANAQNQKACVLPGYRLENTLSSSGGVNRGICVIDSGGYLESIHEVRNIMIDDTMVLQADPLEEHISIKHDSLVSMTFWGFVPSIFVLLENEFQAFMNETPNLEQDEFYIPNTVNQGISSGQLDVQLYETSELWKGITYSEDRTDVKAYISKLTDAGLYFELNRS